MKAGLLGLGGIIEPLADPKPGGVTRREGWRDLSIYSFAKAHEALRAALETSCIEGCRPGCLARGVNVYLSMLERLGLLSNTNLGTLILMIPLACAPHHQGPEAHAREASRCASLLGREDARAYYRALERFYPSHLGTYEGPIPGVGSGKYPSTFLEILMAARWDYVHFELLSGYPKTLEAYYYLKTRGDSEESVARLILEFIARYGDTLIARRHGWRAMLRAMAEARLALTGSRGEGLEKAILGLRREWRVRGWTPGAVLDIVAAGLGLYYLHG